jgi:hypothetical protein
MLSWLYMLFYYIDMNRTNMVRVSMHTVYVVMNSCVYAHIFMTDPKPLPVSLPVSMPYCSSSPPAEPQCQLFSSQHYLLSSSSPARCPPHTIRKSMLLDSGFQICYGEQILGFPSLAGNQALKAYKTRPHLKLGRPQKQK